MVGLLRRRAFIVGSVAVNDTVIGLAIAARTITVTCVTMINIYK